MKLQQAVAVLIGQSMTMTTQKDDISASKEYQNLILNITTIIHSSRSAAARSVNRAVVELRATITSTGSCSGTLETTQKKDTENK